MEMKKCTKCGIEFPATTEWFHKHSTNSDGLKFKCKKCCSQERLCYYKINKEKEKFLAKKYSDSNQEKIKKNHKEYRRKNKEKIKGYVNKEKQKEYAKKYYGNNKGKYIIHWQKRRTIKRNLPSTLTLKEWQSTKDYFNHECAYCGKKLKKLEQDHFWPLSKSGEYTRFNIIPACKSCNTSKKNKPFEEWYPTHESYSPEREAKIFEYFNQLALENGGWGRQRYDLGTVTVEVINEDL